MPTRSSDTPLASRSGIQTTAEGASFIPSSRRADGSTRKEIKVRPGYRPPEDIETYKNRSAEAWKNRGKGGIPGAETLAAANEDAPAKSKNAKRREAARRKAATEGSVEDDENALTAGMQKTGIFESGKSNETGQDPSKLGADDQIRADADAEQQKKIRNQLKKLRAIRELRDKRAAGEKLSPDQIMKIGKEGELLRDLKKLGYDGPEVDEDSSESAKNSTPEAGGG